jgi:hypothetical protein
MAKMNYSQWKERMLVDYDKMTEKMSLSLIDQKSDTENINYILTKKKEYGPERIAELLFPYAIKDGSLPDQIDGTFMESIVKNDDFFFNLVVLTLERYNEYFTKERFKTYMRYCLKYKNKKYLRILESRWYCDINTKYSCNYCFLYNMIPKGELCTCNNNPPKIYMGMEL